jgi:hypothetical protein
VFDKPDWRVTGDPLQTGTSIQAVKPTAYQSDRGSRAEWEERSAIFPSMAIRFSKTVRLRESISGDTVSKQSVSIGAPDNDLHSARA